MCETHLCYHLTIALGELGLLREDAVNTQVAIAEEQGATGLSGLAVHGLLEIPEGTFLKNVVREEPSLIENGKG